VTAAFVFALRCNQLNRVDILQLYFVYTIKQTSSNHQTNIEQLKHTSCTCILNAFVGCLLDDCLMFVWSCKRGIKFGSVLSVCTRLNSRAFECSASRCGLVMRIFMFSLPKLFPGRCYRGVSV